MLKIDYKYYLIDIKQKRNCIYQYQSSNQNKFDEILKVRENFLTQKIPK